MYIKPELAETLKTIAVVVIAVILVLAYFNGWG
jgi:hypothetical protein